nr:MAG TPA: hypothetical protein [Caudoviricetes sp.]
MGYILFLPFYTIPRIYEGIVKLLFNDYIY